MPGTKLIKVNILTCLLFVYIVISCLFTIFQGGDKKAEKEKEAAEAAAVARQNQLNEQQAQGDFTKNSGFVYICH